jgi:stage III sporulation protein AD
MDIMQVVGFGIVATVMAMVVKEQKPAFAFLIVMATGVVIFLSILDSLRSVILMIERLAYQSNVNMIFLGTVLKIIGIAYIAEFGAQITKDAGQEGIASKIELAGKILILALAVPIISIVVETVLKLMPS